MTTTMITIKMSESAPVRLDTAQWPVIAEAYKFRADTEWAISVREHADGRRIVYGSCTEGRGGQTGKSRPSYAGHVIPASDPAEQDAQTIRAIRRVAGVIEDDDLGAEVIGKLPAREI